MRWLALIGISILAFTGFLDVTIINVALPFIKQVFQASILELQWVTNIYSMILTMTMIAAGRLADLYGRKKIFYSGVIIFGAAALGAGFSPTIEFLIICRALQGLGVSVLFVSSASLIADIFPPEEQGKAIGVYSSITGLGLASGPFLGGLLITWFDWRSVFWVNIPIIIVGALLCVPNLKLTKQEKATGQIDWKGLALLISGLGSLIYGIIAVADENKEGLWGWIVLLLGVTLLIYFFISEKGTKEPLLDLSLFKNKLIQLAILSCSSAGIASFVLMFFDPLYLQILRALDAMTIGLLIATIPLAQVVISIFFSPLLHWLGLQNLMIISVATAFVAAFLHLLIGAHTHLGFLIIPFMLLGVNWGISNAGTIASVNQVIDEQKRSIAIGSIFMLWNMTGSIFLALSSAIFHRREGSSFLTGFHSVVWFNTLFLLFMLILTLFLYRRSRVVVNGVISGK